MILIITIIAVCFFIRAFAGELVALGMVVLPLVVVTVWLGLGLSAIALILTLGGIK
jgi:hypothetical protein